MKRDKIEKTLSKLHLTHQLSQDVDTLISQINTDLSTTPTTATDAFKVFAKPQENISYLISFYRTFLRAVEKTRPQVAAIEEAGEMGNKIKVISDCIEKHRSVVECLNALHEYRGVKVVDRFVLRTRGKIDRIVDVAYKAFFKMFKESASQFVDKKSTTSQSAEKESINIYADKKSTPIYADKKSTNIYAEKETNFNNAEIKTNFNNAEIKTYFNNAEKEMRNISLFLIENKEQYFIQNYCKAVFQIYSSKSIENESERVIGRLESLEAVYEDMRALNRRYLDDKNLEIVNLQVRQLLVIELRVILSKTCLNFENRYRSKNLQQACDLFVLLHKKHLVEYFREFMQELLSTINNLLLTFMHKIRSEKKPDKNLKSEDFNVVAYKVLKAFSNDEFEAFFKQFKDNFEFNDYREMRIIMAETCLSKVFDLGGKYKGIQRNVYFLNNIHVIQFFNETYKGTRMIEYIERYSNEIVSMWEDECRKRRGKDVSRFLEVNFEIQIHYSLPEDIREPVLVRIASIVNNLVKESRCKMSHDAVKMNVSRLFSGAK